MITKTTIRMAASASMISTNCDMEILNASDNAGGIQEIFVISVNVDLIPLFLGAAIDNLSQAGTAVK